MYLSSSFRSLHASSLTTTIPRDMTLGGLQRKRTRARISQPLDGGTCPWSYYPADAPHGPGVTKKAKKRMQTNIQKRFQTYKYKHLTPGYLITQKVVP